MIPAELRCTAPHPKILGWSCRAKLADAVLDSVTLSPGVAHAPGCVVLRCDRCGAEYTVCPVKKAS